ncbi:MAG TPA: InlB B-repeat-containing protein, partial [Methanocorpusculum sp.]|nr:InlB B-repeat-containing protein [Methanocorpusculum sp.]
NKANGDGGGVYVSYDGEFEMSSGTISDNTASEGGGVYVIGIFELSGSSSVDSVYLTSDKVINVTEELTGTGPQVTDINLQSPVHGTKVVTISLAVSEPNYLNYFQLNASLEGFALEYLSPDIVLNQLSCIVSFDAQGGTPTLSEQSVQYGNTVSEPDPAPTWEGHTLEGWYTEAACLNLWDFTTPVTSDITLYAGWKEDEPGPGPEPTPVPPSGSSSGDGNMENAFRVLFNDGATTLTVQTDLSYGDKLTKPEDPVKGGYTFAGWHKDTACTQPWDFETSIPGDMTLYAKWTAIEATPTATATATATAVTTPQPTKTQTTAAATPVPQAPTAAAVSPTLVQTPAPVAGALLGLLAAGLLLRRRLQ